MENKSKLPLPTVALISKANAGMTGTSRYSSELRRSLEIFGVDVKVITPNPVFQPSWANKLGWDLNSFFATYPLHTPIYSADICHLTSQTLGTLLWTQKFSCPVVITVFDIIPLIVLSNPSLDISAHGLNRWFFKIALQGLKRASVIITISKYSKRTIIDSLRLPSNRVVVVYPPVDHSRFYPIKPSDEFLQRYKLDQSKRTILYVGSDDPRKNLDTLLSGFLILKNRFSDVQLMIVGSEKIPGERERLLALAERLGICSEFRLFSDVPDADLPYFYSYSNVFAFPSLYEGFGLPVVEAMACGLPVVVSDTTSLPEVVDKSGLLFDPLDAMSLANCITDILANRDLAQDLSLRGIRRSHEFSLSRMAEEVINIYQLLLCHKFLDN